MKCIHNVERRVIIECHTPLGRDGSIAEGRGEGVRGAVGPEWDPVRGQDPHPWSLGCAEQVAGTTTTTDMQNDVAIMTLRSSMMV